MIAVARASKNDDARHAAGFACRSPTRPSRSRGRKPIAARRTRGGHLSLQAGLLA